MLQQDIAIGLIILILIGLLIIALRKIRGNRSSRLDSLLTIIGAKEAFCRREAFGVSPGTLTQLAANHVPTVEDIPMLRQWVADRKQGIHQMTESDLINQAPMEYSILGNRIGAFA